LTTAFIDFFSGPPTCTTAGIGTAGCFDTANASLGGSFQNTSNAPNTIQDLSNANDGGDGSGPTPAANYILFNFTTPPLTIHFDLQNVFAGVGTDCATLTLAQLTAAGTQCTPHVHTQTGPFVLTNNAGSTVGVSLVMSGQSWTGTTATGTTDTTIIFTTQYAGTNIANLLSAPIPPNTWSATLITTAAPTVPEPSTAYFVFGALLTVPFIAARRRKRM